MKGEGARQTGMAMVVAVLPDVCLTPMGATPVPVLYPIVGFFSNCAVVAQTVRMCGRPTFTTASNVTTVVGDEAGTAGGVQSGVNKSICESVTASTTVKAEGNRVLRHGDQMKMNKGNTIGTLVYMPGVGPVLVGVPSDDGPPAWKVLLDIDGLGTRLGEFKDAAVEFVEGNAQRSARQLDQLSRLAKGDTSAGEEMFGDLVHQWEHQSDWIVEDTYGAYQRGGWNAVRGRLGFEAFQFAAPEALHGRFGRGGGGGRAAPRELPGGKPELPAAGETAGTTPSSERPTAELHAADSTPSTERSTAEMDAVDPDSTAKIKAQDGVRVKGPPKTNGIPKSALHQGDICFGLYNKEPTMGKYLDGTGANVVSDLPNPPTDMEAPPGGMYSNAYELSKGYLDNARVNHKQVHFDMNGVNPDDAFNERSPNYKSVTSEELRHTKANWDGFDPKPKFWKDGEEVPPPW